MLDPDLTRALAGIGSVGVITGAGVSVESGIRPYRGVGGLYDDPEEGDRVVEALTGRTLAVDPDRTWRAVASVALQAGAAAPNAAHRAIAAIERAVDDFVLLTQNVDGLHRAAGSRNVIRLHGSVDTTTCLGCGRSAALDPARLRGLERAPRCEACGSVVRPDVVLFEEALPAAEVARLEAALYDRSPELVLAVGTTALFAYIAEPVRLAAVRGSLTIEVNPEPTELSGVVDHALRGPAGAILPALAAALAGPDREP